MAHGDVLIAFADDIVLDGASLSRSRAAVCSALGPEAMVDAAGVTSNFERMVRIADATGIELGKFLEDVSAEARTTLRLKPARDQQPVYPA